MTKIQIDRALLAQHIAEIDAWNASMEQILGRQPERKWLSLEALRAALLRKEPPPCNGCDCMSPSTCKLRFEARKAQGAIEAADVTIKD